MRVVKRYSSEIKLKVVLAYLKGKPASEVCNKFNVPRTTLHDWEKTFLANGTKAFETNKITKDEEKMKEKIIKMKSIIADLTFELKKNDDELI